MTINAPTENDFLNYAGAKADGDKCEPHLILGEMPRALWAVIEVATYGKRKYTESGWLHVQDGIKRYANAMERHQLKEAMGEKYDPDTDFLHAAHTAWNALARLELMLRAKENPHAQDKPSNGTHDPKPRIDLPVHQGARISSTDPLISISSSVGGGSGEGMDKENCS